MDSNKPHSKMDGQSNENFFISFENVAVYSWLKVVADVQKRLTESHSSDEYGIIKVAEDITPSNLSPLHLVTLACLILSLMHHGISGRIEGSVEMIDFLTNDLHLNEYFTSQSPYVDSKSDYTLNLWLVSPVHSLLYSQHVADYLKRRYFTEKDLSGLRVILDELYANIADHSSSKGVAYSFIRYDEERSIIQVAFCDFGIGIKESLRRSGIVPDKEYILTATTKGVTAHSNTHNKGFGLDTVISSVIGTGNVVRICSGSELFVFYGSTNSHETFECAYEFPGTLVYLDIDISTFEDADYIDDFEL